jgi:hypothetical protein
VHGSFCCNLCTVGILELLTPNFVTVGTFLDMMAMRLKTVEKIRTRALHSYQLRFN